MQTSTRTVRTALAIGATAAACILPATAHAASTTDPAVVAGLATDAVALLSQEHALLIAGAQDPDQLRSIDEQGAALLDQFDGLSVDLPPAARTALAVLPAAGARPDAAHAPSPTLYDAAITAMQRIADTPEAVLPPTPSDDGGTGDLVAVAMGVALALGLIVRSVARDRREDDDELELELLEWSDGLTGVASRRRLDRDLAVAEQADLGPTAVVMVDVDHFQDLVGSYGHATGDEVLRVVAMMLTEQVREHDVVYRYGGEEFCVLLLDADADAATAVGERIVDAARRIQLPDGSHLTVSAGLSTGASDLHLTLEDADRALLEAKVAGRDRLHRADALTPA